MQRYPDRFNRRFAVAAGWNTITIPLSDVRQAPHERMMDMRHLMAVGLFAARLDRPRVVYLDRVRLLPTP